MHKQLENMRSVKGWEKAAEDLLDKWPISGWCLAFFNTNVKCNYIDNNMCKTFNGVMLEVEVKLSLPCMKTLESM